MTQKAIRNQYPTGVADWATVSQWEDDGRPDLHNDGSPATVCEWFAGCLRGAIGVATHPVLSPVPCCKRCAEKMGLELQPLPQDGAR